MNTLADNPLASVEKLIPRERTNGDRLDTEDALALAFVRQQLDAFRYVPGWDWIAWDDSHWRRDVRLQHLVSGVVEAREFDGGARMESAGA